MSAYVPRPWTPAERARNRELFLQKKREEWCKAIAAGKLDGVLADPQAFLKSIV